MYTIIYFLLLLLVFYFINVKTEMFTNYDYNDEHISSTRFSPLDLKKQHVPDHLKVSGLKRQKHLDLLGNIKDRLDQSSLKVPCDNKINAQVENQVLNDVFKNLQKEAVHYKTEFSKNNKTKGIDCVAVASDICEFTNPYFYLSQSLYFPPPWSVNSFKNIEYQKNVNLSCFNKNYDCCRASLPNR